MYRLLLTALAVYFALRLFMLACTMPVLMPPDEVSHIERVQHFSNSLLLPSADVPAERAHLRLLHYQPYLYYFIAGKWVSLNIFDVEDYVFIRFLSIPMALLMLYYGWRFIRLLSDDRLVHLLCLTMTTNTLMFNIIAAAVSYDTLTCLWATMSLYYFAEFMLRRTPISICYLLLSMALGCLTKITILPLAFILALCFLVMEAKNAPHFMKALRPFWQSLGKSQKAWVCITLIAITLNGLLYGGNILQFNHLTPRPAQLLNDDEILLNPVYARNSIHMAYLAGELTKDQAYERAEKINHEGMKNATVDLLKLVTEREEAGITFKPVSRIEYVKHWYPRMIRSIYGVFGHIQIFRHPDALLSYSVIFVLTLGSIGLYATQKKILPLEIALMFTIASYTLILMQVVNYPVYRSFQAFHVTLAGRYMFPLIVPIYALIAKYMLTSSTQRIKTFIALSIALLFIYGDFIFYMNEQGV